MTVEGDFTARERITTALELENTDATGRNYYAPITATIIGISRYTSDEFLIAGLDGYWKWWGEDPLQVGAEYELVLATKPKAGPNTKPGALYRDIRGAAATGLVTPPAPRKQPQNGSQGRGLPSPVEPESHQDVIQYRISVGMASNIAALWLAHHSDGIPTPLSLRFLRDQVYLDAVRHPVCEHWCHEHMEPLILSPTGVWGHVLDDGTGCVEGGPDCGEV